jgi:hypothetical protein
LNQLGEWRQLETQLEAQQNAWYTAATIFEQRYGSFAGTAPGEAREQTASWNELVRLIQQKDRAAIPPGLGAGTVVLLALVAVGIVWPLLALPAPKNSQQVVFLLPWLVLLLLFGLVTYVRARTVLSGLKKKELWNPVQKRYDEYMGNVEAQRGSEGKK